MVSISTELEAKPLIRGDGDLGRGSGSDYYGRGPNQRGTTGGRKVDHYNGTSGTELRRRIIFRLKQRFMIVTVAHNIQQASRVGESAGLFVVGNLIECDKAERIFTNPSDKGTGDYITGRFG